MKGFIKWMPLWIFLPLVILLTLYPPVELSRVIYVTAFKGIIISKAGYSSLAFTLELMFLWVFMVMGWLLVYLRVKK
jgi:hypothetical protein